MNILAVHLNHDSVLSLDLHGVLHNIELERIFGKRHYDVRHEKPDVHDLIAIVRNIHPTFDAGMVLHGADSYATQLFEGVGVKSIEAVDHHKAHAAAAFYESPFDRSLIVSYDGGGNDGTFRIFLASRETGIAAIDDGHRLNLGIPYRAIAHPIVEIRKPDDGKERSNAGKLMGLAAFGQVRPEWVEPVRDFFMTCSGKDTFSGMYLWVVGQLGMLGQRIGLPLSRNALSGADAFDLAATAQHVFERIFLDTVLPIAARYKLPICISGGCALNVMVNQQLADLIEWPVFVPPNPNDCGLAQGALLLRSRPVEPVTVTYTGPAIQDPEALPAAVARLGAVKTGTKEIAELLHAGNVIAVMRGRSEHGPRALGHRSILADPSVPGMKDRLNNHVKFRETFRPYAPVVRVADVHRYFDNARNDMSYMSFNPTVSLAWREKLAAATHVDGTARVQTIASTQNPWLYDVLTEFERLSGFGALVNTSFNSKGRPIVTSVAEAVDLLLTTDLDYLVIEDWLFRKPADEQRPRSPST
ncbi:MULTISPECIES: carbamoyltransferase C-terminal domain-containing protein [unclassified Caulobacter]|uniref:carbamoyltransferase C-terminal domain-containing protein n=1 Tax=unclassified Caulobacter TaxID=2648921 RepID=UPI0011B794D9|nr:MULTISPECIES: carbamoyltransferase C-terminal domain-containing protein [unclassified Caulobacter]